MGKQALRGTAVALGVAAAAFVYYGMVLDVYRGGMPWDQVVGGLLTGAAVLGVWSLARSRPAAVSGLVVMATLVFLGMDGTVVPARGLSQAPLSWAVMLTLVGRLAMPGSGSTHGDRSAHAPEVAKD